MVTTDARALVVAVAVNLTELSKGMMRSIFTHRTHLNKQNRLAQQRSSTDLVMVLRPDYGSLQTVLGPGHKLDTPKCNIKAMRD